MTQQRYNGLGGFESCLSSLRMHIGQSRTPQGLSTYRVNVEQCELKAHRYTEYGAMHDG
jgi:hypothetical protein